MGPKTGELSPETASSEQTSKKLSLLENNVQINANVMSNNRNLNK